MTINYLNGKIEMTKTEAKAASIYGSDAYNDLQNAKRDNPGFIVVIEKTSGKKRDHFKGLSFDYMEKYIKGHNLDLLDVFMQLRALDEKSKELNLISKSYGEIRMWFLENFPEFEKYTQDTDEILNRARAAREAKKAS